MTILKKSYFLNRNLPLFFLLTTTLILVYFIIYNAQWIYGDDFEFLLTTAIGKMEWEAHFNGNMGRFLPLCHFDFNILTLTSYGTTPTAHYIIVASSLILFVYCSFHIYYHAIKNSQFSTKLIYWLIYLLITFLMYYFSRIFFHLNYPERIIVVLLSVFILTYQYYIKSKKKIYLLISLLTAIYTTYCKEPVFIIFVSIGLVNLIFNLKKVDRIENIYFIFLILNGIIFLTLYYFVSLRNTVTFYKGGNYPNFSLFELFKFTLGNLKILWFGLILTIWIIIKKEFLKDRNTLFYFSLMSSGIFYAFSCFILNLQQPYYYFPAVLLTFPPIVNYLVKYLKIEYLVAAMFVLVLHYGKKFPYAIQNFQYKRSSTFEQINLINTLIENNFKCYWHIDPIQTTSQPLQKYITEVFINHYNNRVEDYKFEKIESFPDSISINTIIFCENSEENHKLMIKNGLKKMDIDQIWNTIVLLK